MPDQRNPPILRTRQNSQFTVQLESVDAAKKQESLPEMGAMIESDGLYFVGNGDEWIQFAPIDNRLLQIGWARYDDTQYIGENTYNFTTAEFFLPNNRGVRIDNYNLNAYNGTQFTLEEGATYSLTIAFKAHLNTNNGHLQINLECPLDTDYSRIGDIIVFPKGNGIEHIYSRVFNFYANADIVRGGLKVKMRASHTGSIYDAIYYIQKLSNA